MNERGSCEACGATHGLEIVGSPPVRLCWTCRDKWKAAGGEIGLSPIEWLKTNTQQNVGDVKGTARCIVCGKLSDAAKAVAEFHLCGTHHDAWIASREHGRANMRDLDDFVRRVRAEFQNGMRLTAIEVKS